MMEKIGPVRFAKILEQLIRTKKWDEKWGDRRQEMIFIGIKMNKDQMIKELESCLLTPEEMKGGP
jgi:hypothetical protein